MCCWNRWHVALRLSPATSGATRRSFELPKPVLLLTTIRRRDWPRRSAICSPTCRRAVTLTPTRRTSVGTKRRPARLPFSNPFVRHRFGTRYLPRDREVENATETIPSFCFGWRQLGRVHLRWSDRILVECTRGAQYDCYITVRWGDGIAISNH